MDERRDPQPDSGTGPTEPAASTLPTAQQAHLDYSKHIEGAGRVRGCQRCSDVDRDRCAEGDRLWQAWNTALNDAYDRLVDETR